APRAGASFRFDATTGLLAKRAPRVRAVSVGFQPIGGSDLEVGGARPCRAVRLLAPFCAMELSALVVKIRVKAEYREQFLEQMWADAIGSEKNEPGCLMFNIVRDNADPNVLH